MGTALYFGVGGRGSGGQNWLLLRSYRVHVFLVHLNFKLTAVLAISDLSRMNGSMMWGLSCTPDNFYMGSLAESFLHAKCLAKHPEWKHGCCNKLMQPFSLYNNQFEQKQKTKYFWHWQ